LVLDPFCLSAAEFSGAVVKVLDGDTIDVLHNGQAERIRLAGIDCPEKGQAFWKKARHFTSSLVAGKQVTVKAMRRDGRGRTVANVVLPDGRNISQELVKAGMAWWYRKYAGNDQTLAQLEGEAQEHKRGLWADANPVPPWEVRHPEKAPKSAKALDSRGAVTSASQPDTTPTIIIGNRRSRIYQRPDCPNYTATAPKNRVIFNSESEAKAAGYHLAENCPR